MLSFVYVIQCENASSKLSERAKKKELILHLNNGKYQTFTILQLNVVHLDTKDIIIFNNLYIIRDNFEKKW